MKFVKTNECLTVIDEGRKPIIVPNAHPNYQIIIDNIYDLSYNEVQSLTNIKASFTSLSTDDVFISLDEDEILQIDLTDNALKSIDKNLKDMIIKSIIENAAHKEELKNLSEVFKATLQCNLVSLTLKLE